MMIKFNLITFSNYQKIGSTLQLIFTTFQRLDVFQAINYQSQQFQINFQYLSEFVYVN